MSGITVDVLGTGTILAALITNPSLLMVGLVLAVCGWVWYVAAVRDEQNANKSPLSFATP